MEAPGAGFLPSLAPKKYKNSIDLLGLICKILACGWVQILGGRWKMTYERAMEVMDRDESFRAVVYAMNTLMLQKGLYTGKEFEFYFCQHAQNFVNGFQGASERAKEHAPETVVASP